MNCLVDRIGKPALRRALSALWTGAGALLVTALLAAPMKPAAAVETLGLQEALSIARERSRQLSAQDAAAGAAREMSVAAAQLPDPILKFGINNLPIDGPDRFSLTRDFMTMRSIGVMQELTRESKRKARAARFEGEADVAHASKLAALADLQRDTAVAWLERYYLEAMRKLLAQQRDEAQLQVQAAESLYRANRGTQADVFTALAAVEQLEDRVAQSERQIAVAKTMLSRWVGDSADRPLDRLPSIDAVRLTAADLDARLEHHPQITVMMRQVALAEAEVELAKRARQSDWSVEVMFNQRGPAYSNMVSVNLSVPLQWDQRNRQDREVAAKLAMVEQMRAQREEAVRVHVAEARAMLQQWHSDRDRLKRYGATLVPLATERTRAALAAYRAGAGLLNSVLEARRSEIEVRIEGLRLEMETARLWAQLNYLIPIDHTAPAGH